MPILYHVSKGISTCIYQTKYVIDQRAARREAALQQIGDQAYEAADIFRSFNDGEATLGEVFQRLGLINE